MPKASLTAELKIANSDAIRSIRESKKELASLQASLKTGGSEIRVDNRAALNSIRQATEAGKRYQEEMKKISSGMRTPLPEINRPRLSGQGPRVRSLAEYDALTARGGRGSRGGASSKGGDATQAFYIGQDLAQGGPSAVLNQLPIALDLASRYTQKFTGAIKGLGPVMGTVAAASAAVAAYWAGGKIGEYLSGNSGAVEGDEAMGKWTDNEQKRLRAFQNRRARERAAKTGEAEASNVDTIVGRGGQRIDEAVRNEKRQRERLELEADLERAKIDNIQDESRKSAASRALEKRLIQEEAAARIKFTEENLRIATESAAVSSAKLKQAASALDLVGSVDTAERARLEPLVSGLRGTDRAAQERVKAARIDLEDARANSSNAGLKTAAIDARAAGASMTSFFDKLKNGMEAMKRIAEAYEQARLDAERRAKQQAGLKEQLAIDEARGSGNTRKANKLQKAANLRASTQKFLDAGFSPEEAAPGMARREQDALTRDPRKIRGAGYGGDKTPRKSALDDRGPSALDAFRNEKGMAGRGLFTPKRGKPDPTVTPEVTGSESAAAVQKADPAVVTLLQDIKDGIRSLTGKRESSN